MRKTLYSLLLLFPVLLFGQKVKCTTSFDEFTKRTTIETGKRDLAVYKPGGLMGKYFLVASVRKVQGFYFIHLVPEFPVIQTITEETPVMFLLENGQIIEFKHNSFSISDTKPGRMFSQGGGSSIWYNSLDFNLKTADKDLLAKFKVKKVRIGAYDFEATDQLYFFTAFKCIDNEAD